MDADASHLAPPTAGTDAVAPSGRPPARGGRRGRSRRGRGAAAAPPPSSATSGGPGPEPAGGEPAIGGGERGRGGGGRGRGRGRSGRGAAERARPVRSTEGLEGGAGGAAAAVAAAKSRHRLQKASAGDAGVGSSSRAPAASGDDAADGGGGGGGGGGTELATRLSQLMLRGQNECCVCLDAVRRNSPLWSCGTCYAIVHLTCAKKWARRTDEDSGDVLGFCCPSCRSAVDGGAGPLVFRCYCGRLRNPPLEAGLVPGSCGEPCLRTLGAASSGCEHRCGELCHPGPCEPCGRRGASQACHCGKEDVPRHCGDAVPPGGVSCGQACGAVQEVCGHSCAERCHAPGSCGECLVSIALLCFCGSTSTDLPCALSVAGYSCGGACHGLLSCGQHRCEASCHNGKCAPCSLDPALITTCVCGKQDLSPEQLQSRRVCTDPIPSCGMPCGRPLGCLAQHQCPLTCGHDGPCGPCARRVDALCRCGASVIPVVCGAGADGLRRDLECSSVCPEKRTCRKHPCGRKCCKFRKQKALVRTGVVETERLFHPGSRGSGHQRANVAWRREGHACREACEAVLSCGLHLCDAQCGHPGDCAPCGLLIREPVACSCGSSSWPPPVRCGTAPPACTLPCSKVREDCSHRCRDRCHQGACPPCVELLRKECVGLHGEGRFVPCHIGGRDGIRCHRPCGRPLACGVHVCSLGCHPGPFPATCEESASTGCNQVCGLPRPCGHSDPSICHPDTPCPETPCMVPVTVRCSCGRRSEQAPCLRGGRGLVPLGSDGFIRLHCDSECDEQRRLTAFASAIGTTPTSLTAMRQVGRQTGGTVGEDGLTVYSPFLLDFASRNAAAVAHFERELATIVAGMTRKVDFGPLPQLHRAVVHSLAELGLMDSKSIGSAGHGMRHLVVCHRGAGTKPVAPIPSLSEAAAQEELRKRELNSPLSRSILIFVPRAAGQPLGMDIEARVRRELSTHLSCIKVVRRQAMSEAGGDEGVLLEFSTLPRMELALSSLRTRPGVVVARPPISTVRPPNPRPVRASDAAKVVSPWASGDSGSRPAGGRVDGRAGSTPAAVGGVASLLLSTRAPPAEGALEGVPDSWEDS